MERGLMWSGCVAVLPWLVACGSGTTDRSGSTDTERARTFASKDCPERAFVEIARIPAVQSADSVSARWTRGLAVSNDRLFFMRDTLFKHTDQMDDGVGLRFVTTSWEEIIVGTIPTSGGDLVDVAATPGKPDVSEPPAFFTVGGDTLFVAGGGRTASVQLGQDIVTLPPLSGAALEQNVADDDSIYTVFINWDDYVTGSDAWPVQVLRTPRAGGDSTVLYRDQLVGARIGSVTDIGDAVLVSLGWSEANGPGYEHLGKVIRVPKDGEPATRVRKDVPFSSEPSWLGWDGGGIEASVDGDTDIDGTYRARVPLDGGPVVRTRLPVGGFALPTADGLLVANSPVDDPHRLALMSVSKNGDEEVIACGPETSGASAGIDVLGIARDAHATYIAQELYGESDLVIYRVDD